MKTLYTLILVIAGLTSHAQVNLVPNPGFEKHKFCPDGIGQINKATGWVAIRNTPDYFNSCSPSFDFSVPSNSFGFQYPSSQNCTAYVGLFTYPFSREYLGIRLDTTLVVGQKYFVSLKVVRANEQSSSTNNIGVLFTTYQSIQGTLDSVKNFAHIRSTAVVTDTLNWTTVFGSLVADSSYNFIEIGNFYDDSNTVVIANDSGIFYGAYYFIDDICVSTDSLFCADYTFTCTTGIKENSESDISFYPNPTGSLLYFNSPGKYLIKVFDMEGKMLMEFNKSSDNNYINLSSLPDGIYFVALTSNQKTFNSKIEIIH